MKPPRIVRQWICEHIHTHEVDWRTEMMMGIRQCRYCLTPMPLERPTVATTHPDSGD